MTKCAADFRKIARDGLRGRWIIAVIVGIVASLLGGVSSGSVTPTIDFNVDEADFNIGIAGQELFSTANGFADIDVLLTTTVIYVAIIFLVIGVLYFILGSVVGVGYAQFNLDIADGYDASFNSLFAHFQNWKTTAAARFLQGLYITLWTFLFIIPGIIAAFNYSMTEFVLAEHPELSASDALRRSKYMMRGNRWRAFCLGFSFIGWSLLSALTLGIGNLWLNPYISASRAAFYRDVATEFDEKQRTICW